jgi:hypothetical protein
MRAGTRNRATTWLAVTFAIVASGCSDGGQATPACSRPGSDIIVLEAQSVPTATRLPCVADLPIGWSFAGALARNDETTFWLDHDRAGVHAVEVVMRASCDTSSAERMPPSSDEAGMQIYEEATTLQPAFTGSRFQVFEGGCIEYRYSFSDDVEPTLVIEVDQALSTVARSDLVSSVADRFGLTLCGAGAPPCEG